MRVNDDYKMYNVVAQQNDNASVLALWKDMLALRKREEDVLATDPQLPEMISSIFADVRILQRALAE